MEYFYKIYKINTEIKIINIYKLCIAEKINHHTQLFLAGSFSRDLSDDMIKRTNLNSKIEIKDRKDNIVFCGIMKDIKTSVTKDIYEFECNAISYSFYMDIKKQKRTFQNLDLTYQDIIEEIMKSYPQGMFLDTISENRKIPHIFVQYEETDWEFIKRLASSLSGVICVHAKAEYPQFFFGFPNTNQNHEIKNKNDTIEKNLEVYIKTAKNYQREIQHCDEMVYTIETYEKFNLSEQVIYKNKELIISEVKTIIKREEVIFQYKFTSKKAVQLKEISNAAIQGVRLQAVIKEIKGNTARLYFDIDREYTEGNNMFFTYSGEENNRLGYYMAVPESKAEVYFPNTREENAFISAFVREENENTEYNPSEKYFRNEYKKEMLIGKENLKFTAGKNGIQINMKRNGEVIIHSSAKIKIDAGREAYIGIKKNFRPNISSNAIKDKIAKRILIQAENNIRFQVNQAGNNYIELNENANIICKASQNVLHKGKKEEKKKEKNAEPKISKQNIELLRRNIMAFSGVEFVSQTLNRTADFEKARQEIRKIIPKTTSASNKESETESNPIRDELLEKDEKLFKKFSYGENLNGNEK